jgi:hypothetical protein
MNFINFIPVLDAAFWDATFWLYRAEAGFGWLTTY